MIYVFDTSIFVKLFGSYYRGRFPSLWKKFDSMISARRITSTREVRREIEDQTDELDDWANKNPNVFPTPKSDVGIFVTEIYLIRHFQANIEKKKLLKGGKCADPFVVATALASVPCGTVVTLEVYKPHSAKIPNICSHFGIVCLNLEEFMEKENWVF